MHRVLMSFTYRKGWHVCFFEASRQRRQLPRLAFLNSYEALVEFSRRAGGPRTLENRNLFDMMIRRSFGEITLELTPRTVRQTAATARLTDAPCSSQRLGRR